MKGKKRYMVQINESPYSKKGKFVIVQKVEGIKMTGVRHKHIDDPSDDWHIGNKAMFRPLTKKEKIELALKEGY